MRGCGEPSCCPDPFDHRRVLDLAMRALPPVAAGVLRRRVEQLDAFIADPDELPDSWAHCSG